MKNLYKLRIMPDSCNIIKYTTEDITIVKKELIVSRKDRNYDLKYGNYDYVEHLNKLNTITKWENGNRVFNGYEISYIDESKEIEFTNLIKNEMKKYMENELKLALENVENIKSKISKLILIDIE